MSVKVEGFRAVVKVRNSGAVCWFPTREAADVWAKQQVSKSGGSYYLLAETREVSL